MGLEGNSVDPARLLRAAVEFLYEHRVTQAEIVPGKDFFKPELQVSFIDDTKTRFILHQGLNDFLKTYAPERSLPEPPRQPAVEWQ